MLLHYNTYFALQSPKALSPSRRLGYREVDYSHAFREHEFRFEMTATPHVEYELYVNEDEA